MLAADVAAMTDGQRKAVSKLKLVSDTALCMTTNASDRGERARVRACGSLLVQRVACWTCYAWTAPHNT
jgi:hypothetical protein